MKWTRSCCRQRDGVALNGELIASEAYRDATIDTRYVVFSATKAFVAGVMWALIGDGLVDVSKRVRRLRARIRYERQGRHHRRAGDAAHQWLPARANGPPICGHARGAAARGLRPLAPQFGSRAHPYEYHATSAHWVLSAIIENVTGQDFRDVVEQRVTTPAGLPRVLGLDPSQQDGIAELVMVGEPASPAEIKSAFGVEELPVTEVTPDALLAFNRPENREVGVPGGGGAMRASDLALYYQALLHNPGEILEAGRVDRRHQRRAQPSP